jgi:hypothetical protein
VSSTIIGLLFSIHISCYALYTTREILSLEKSGKTYMRPDVRTTQHQRSLSHAQEQAEFVRIDRAIEGTEALAGYVVGLGSHWVLLSVFDGGSPNGWSAVRLADVCAVGAASEGRFVRRVLETQESWPSGAPATEIQLSDGLKELVESATHYFSLVSIFLESEHAVNFFIGRPIRWTPTRLDWQELGRDASWDQETSSYEQAAISRVDIGSRYATALSRISELRGGI